MEAAAETRPANENIEEAIFREGKVLEIRKVRKSFGGLVAVNDVYMDIPRRRLTMLIGPNGSGKTTLINVVTGFYKPDHGEILYEGKDITGLSPHEIFNHGLVRTFQIPRPFQRLTVLENMLLARPRNPGEDLLVKSLLKNRWEAFEEETAERAYELLKFLQLNHLWDQPASNLSGGQMKLLEIGRALMTGAKTILMDEPAAGVNPTLAHQIFLHIKRIIEEFGITFFIVEHRLEIAARYVDYVYAMARGRVISRGTAEQVLHDPLVIDSYLGG